MKKIRIIVIVIFCFLTFSQILHAEENNFKFTNISNRVLILVDRNDGTNQLAIKTSLGMVVLFFVIFTGPILNTA